MVRKSNGDGATATSKMHGMSGNRYISGATSFPRSRQEMSAATKLSNESMHGAARLLPRPKASSRY